MAGLKSYVVANDEGTNAQIEEIANSGRPRGLDRDRRAAHPHLQLQGEVRWRRCSTT